MPKFMIARWYFGFRWGKFSLFTGWINDTTAKNYAELLHKEGVII